MCCLWSCLSREPWAWPWHHCHFGLYPSEWWRLGMDGGLWSRILGLWPRDASSSPPGCDSQGVFRHCHSLWLEHNLRRRGDRGCEGVRHRILSKRFGLEEGPKRWREGMSARWPPHNWKTEDRAVGLSGQAWHRQAIRVRRPSLPSPRSPGGGCLGTAHAAGPCLGSQDCPHSLPMFSSLPRGLFEGERPWGKMPASGTCGPGAWPHCP